MIFGRVPDVLSEETLRQTSAFSIGTPIRKDQPWISKSQLPNLQMPSEKRQIATRNLVEKNTDYFEEAKDVHQSLTQEDIKFYEPVVGFVAPLLGLAAI